MKKTFIALAAATLMGGGLVGVSAESAQAACPYTGCVDTSTQVDVQNAPVARHDSATICVKVTTGGNGQPRGRVSVSVTRSNGGFHYADSKHYDGRTCFQTPGLDKKGKYLVRANFEAGAHTVFKDSGNSTAFRVTRNG